MDNHLAAKLKLIFKCAQVKALSMIDQIFSTDTTATVRNSAISSNTCGEEIEISLIDVLTQLAYSKWLIAKVTGAGMLTGVILCFVLPVKYTASAKIMTPQQSPSSSALMNQFSQTGASSLAALAGGGMNAFKDPNTVYIGLLNSRPIADIIIRKYSLDQVYHAKNMMAARRKLLANTMVASDKTGFISISVTDMDNKRAAEIANAYPDQLRIFIKTLAMTEASQRRIFYEEQLNQAKEKLLSAELAFQQTQQRGGLVQPETQVKAVVESITELHAKVAAKEVEVRALRSYSTEHSPELELAENQLSSLQEEARVLEQQSHSFGFGDLGLSDMPRAGQDYFRTEHELKYQQALFDLLLKQYDAAKLDEAKEAAIIQVVEPAIIPDQKTSPKRALLVEIFSIAGFFAGCLLSLILWQRTIFLSNMNNSKRYADFKFALFGR
jgi:tyrosine-protein kinase Etk/Wzc